MGHAEQERGRAPETSAPADALEDGDTSGKLAAIGTAFVTYPSIIGLTAFLVKAYGVARFSPTTTGALTATAPVSSMLSFLVLPPRSSSCRCVDRGLVGLR